MISFILAFIGEIKYVPIKAKENRIMIICFFALVILDWKMIKNITIAVPNRTPLELAIKRPKIKVI